MQEAANQQQAVASNPASGGMATTVGSNNNAAMAGSYVVDLRVLEAALESDWATVRKLLPSARNMEVADQDGWSVLHFACREGVDDVLKVCLMKGAEVDKVKKNLWTGLHLAARNQKPSTAEILLRHGADPNARNERGNTPLIEVFNRRRKKDSNTLLNLLTMLLQYGADPNLSGEDGKTCLHKAAERGYEEAVAFLLSNSADPSIKDSHGNTPIVLAMAGKNAACVQLLESFTNDKMAQNQQQQAQQHQAATNQQQDMYMEQPQQQPVLSHQMTVTPSSRNEPASGHSRVARKQISDRRIVLDAEPAGVMDIPNVMQGVDNMGAMQQAVFDNSVNRGVVVDNNSAQPAIYYTMGEANSPEDKQGMSTPSMIAQAVVKEQTINETSNPSSNKPMTRTSLSATTKRDEGNKITSPTVSNQVTPPTQPPQNQRQQQSQPSHHTDSRDDERYLQQEIRHQKFLFMFDKMEMSMARMRTEMSRLESRVAGLESEARNSERGRTAAQKTVENRMDAIEKRLTAYLPDAVVHYSTQPSMTNAQLQPAMAQELAQRARSMHQTQQLQVKRIASHPAMASSLNRAVEDSTSSTASSTHRSSHHHHRKHQQQQHQQQQRVPVVQQQYQLQPHQPEYMVQHHDLPGRQHMQMAMVQPTGVPVRLAQPQTYMYQMPVNQQLPTNNIVYQN